MWCAGFEAVPLSALVPEQCQSAFVSTDVLCRYLFIIDCTLNLMVFYGIMGVYVTADLSLANVLSSFFYGLWNLFTGFLIGVNQMAGWWKWL